MNMITDEQAQLLQKRMSWCGCECGLLFTSLSGFDKHHAKDSNGDIICVDPLTVGLILNEEGSAYQFPGMSAELKEELYG
jgi:hypothetical protein